LSGGYFLGVDVGGTFTDVVLSDPQGRVTVTKVVTSPDDPRRGVCDGIRSILDQEGVQPALVSRLVHGTTLATNVILEQRGADVAFITTAGFGDMARLGREFRQEDERFDLFFTTPPPPVPRHRTFEVAERVDARGNVRIAPNPDAVKEMARVVADSGAAGVAICLLHAYANPLHEQIVADEIGAAMGPNAFVVSSSEVWPELREYERAMTTIMCAYVGPIMARYLAGLEDRLEELGITCPVEIMESSGGVMSAALAARRPIYTVESGGAAGVIAAGAVGRLIGTPHIISFDMGGTTAKTGVVRDGRPDVTHDFHVGGRSSTGGRRAGDGYPVKIPVVDLAEVGAGGGSIASVDSGGGLRVGPRSSGSVPGPACYGRGGTEPTVTDANLVLGYLRAGDLSGGVSLSAYLAEEALKAAVAGPLGIDVLSAARAVHDVANANMAAAIRVVTVQRGIDPRDFTLVGFGGAGPMHAAELAATFGITRIVIPRAAGVASAVGLIASDLVVDRVLTRITPLDEADPGALAGLFARLEDEAAKDLPHGQTDLLMTRSADLRYRGQAHQLTVPAPDGPITRCAIDAFAEAFAARYRDAYGIHLEAPVELVNIRVRALLPVEKMDPVPEAVTEDGAGEAQTGHRAVCFTGSEYQVVPVYAWARLHPGSHLDGPAIVEGRDTTVAVPATFTLVTDAWRNLVLTAVDAQPHTTGQYGRGS
jgi:N-methylhydantoinase A